MTTPEITPTEMMSSTPSLTLPPLENRSFGVFTEYNDAFFLLHNLTGANVTASHTLMALFPPGFKTACFVLAGVISLLNGCVITAYVLSRRVRKSMSLFVLNLAVVDFQNGCVSLPLLLLYPRTELQVAPPGGVHLCVLLLVFPQILFIVAYQSVLVVTIERFICVAKPYTYRKLLRKWRCLLAIFILWLFAVFYSLMPTFSYNRITAKGSVYMCNGVYQQGVVYLHVFLYGFLATPIVLIVVLYALMYRIARKHTKSIAKLQSSCALIGEVGKKQRQISRTSKAAKTAGLLSAFYLICWLPFLILLQVSELCKLGYCSSTITTESLQKATPPTIFLAFLGCALNPIIYIYRTGSIRTALRSVLERWRVVKDARRSSMPYASNTTRMSVSTTMTNLQKDDRGYSLASLHSIF